MKQPGRTRSSIQSFMKQQKLFTKPKNSDDEESFSPTFEYLSTPNSNKYMSLRYGNREQEKSRSRSKEKQDREQKSFIKSFIVQDELEQNSIDEKNRHREIGQQSNKIPFFNSGSYGKETRLKSNEIKNNIKIISPIHKNDEISDESPMKGRFDTIPSVAWQSQIIKSSRNYFDSCRGGALDYLVKLEGMLMSDKKLLGKTIKHIREFVMKQLQSTGNKIKQDLYLAVDQAVQYWKQQQSQVCQLSEIDYMGQIFQLTTQVEQRIKQMSQFKSQLQKQSVWRARASDLLTSNYEADITQLSKLCSKAVGEANNNSAHFMQMKHQKVEGGTFSVRDKIVQNIKKTLISLDQDHVKIRSPPKTNNRNYETNQSHSPPPLIQHPDKSYSNGKTSSHKRKQIFQISRSKKYEKFPRKYGEQESQQYDRRQQRRDRSQTQVSPANNIRVEDLKKRMVRAQNRLKRNIQKQQRGRLYSEDSYGYE